MAITGRNMNVGAKMGTAIIAGNSSTPAGLSVSPRSSMKVEELGVTVAGVADSGTPFDLDGNVVVTFRVIVGGSNSLGAYVAGLGVTVGVCTMTTSTTSGSQFTTRDGTLPWSAAYQDPSSRVFAAGSILTAQLTTASGSGNDHIIVYGATSEFGAPPA